MATFRSLLEEEIQLNLSQRKTLANFKNDYLVPALKKVATEIKAAGLKPDRTLKYNLVDDIEVTYVLKGRNRSLVVGIITIGKRGKLQPTIGQYNKTWYANASDVIDFINS